MKSIIIYKIKTKIRQDSRPEWSNLDNSKHFIFWLRSSELSYSEDRRYYFTDQVLNVTLCSGIRSALGAAGNFARRRGEYRIRDQGMESSASFDISLYYLSEFRRLKGYSFDII